MSNKSNKKGKNTKKVLGITSIISAIIIIFIVLVIVLPIISNNKYQYNNKDLYEQDSWKSYEEFNKEYSEYNTIFDVGEKNYYKYENDLFSIKYSDKIKEEHYFNNKENDLLLNNRNELYIFLTNNSKLEVLDAKLGIIYYDNNGEIIDTDTKTVYGLEKSNQSCEVVSVNSQRVKDVKIIINAIENKRTKGLIQNLKTQFITEGRENKVRVINESNYTLKAVQGLIVFYDSDNNIIFSNSIYIFDDIKPNSSKDDEIYIYNENYSNYKIFINNINV